MKETKKIITIPNFITLLRIIAIPTVYYLALRKFYITAILIYFIAIVTDFFDGYIARKYNQTSSFGRKMDAFADGLLIITMPLILYKINYITLTLAIIIFAPRIITALVFIIYSKNKFFTGNYAKTAATLTYTSLIPIILKLEIITYIWIIASYLFSALHWIYIIKKSKSK